MWSCKKQFGNASVRIGITGEGKAPHYKIEYQRDSGGIATFGIYRGLGHRPFEDLGSIDFIVLSDDPAEITEVATEIAKRETPEHPDHFVKVFSWSAQATTFEKIGALRMELQKRRR
jgi:hypothetical protein